MAEQQVQKINPLRQLEQEVGAAKGMKDIVKIDVVKNRHIANYEAITGRTDGLQNYEREAFAFIELANTKPEILDCDPFSIMAGFLRASSYGLPISSGKLSIYPQGVKQKDGSYKQMLLVKPDAHGKKELLTRMPNVKTVDEGILVFKDDKFLYNPKLKKVTNHEQSFPVPKASKETVIAAYCTIHFKDGHEEDIVLSIDEIESARAKSKLPNGQMWGQHYGEGCKKTTYNRAFKVHYITPDTIVLYKQYEAKDQEDDVNTTAEDVTDIPESQSQPAPGELFQSNINEETGEVYQEAKVVDKQDKKKKPSQEAFI